MATARRPCPPAPGPLEDYAAQFDDLFSSLAQRRGFREYLTGLLLPRDRNKTLTALAGAEPVAGAQHPAVQRLQFFLSESTWDPERGWRPATWCRRSTLGRTPGRAVTWISLPARQVGHHATLPGKRPVQPGGAGWPCPSMTYSGCWSHCVRQTGSNSSVPWPSGCCRS
nr:transposase [Streptomyces sp. NWU339]